MRRDRQGAKEGHTTGKATAANAPVGETSAKHKKKSKGSRRRQALVPAGRPDPDGLLSDGGGREPQAAPARLGLRPWSGGRPEPQRAQPEVTGEQRQPINTYQYLPSIVDRGLRRAPLSQRPEDPQAHTGRRSPGDPGRRAARRRRTPPSGRTARSSTSSTSSVRTVPTTRSWATTPGRRRSLPDPLRQLDHPEPARARPAIPAARPCLCELRGLDRRSLLDGGGSGLRLRDEELAPELCGRDTALRLRLLRGQRPAQGLHLPAHARGRVSRSTTTERRWRASRRSRTRTAPRRRPPRTHRSSTRPVPMFRSLAAATTATSRSSTPRRSARRPGMSTTRACRRAAPGDASEVRLLQLEIRRAGGGQLGPNLQLHLAAAGPHRGRRPRKADAGRRRRQQRLGPRPDRRRDLTLLDLEQLADPGRRGRFPGRRRPRRRPPHPGARDQPLYTAGRGDPQPLRPALFPANARDDLGPAVAQSRRGAGGAPL